MQYEIKNYAVALIDTIFVLVFQLYTVQILNANKLTNNGIIRNQTTPNRHN